MAFPQYDKPFVVHVDACEYFLGTALYQRQDGKLRVIAYGSRTLTPAEKNYSLHSGKLEFQALKWSVTEFFRDYLYYSNDFVVYTDNNPLTYVLSTAKLNATGIRWVSELADFNFKIRYRPSRVHRDADGLSRMPMDFEKYMDLCTEETSQEFIKAAINAVHLQNKNLSNWVTSFTTDPDVLDFDPVHKAQNATSRKEQCQFETIDILQAQLDDKNIQRVIELRKSNSKPDSQQRSLELKKTRLLLYEWDKLKFSPDGILMRQCVNKSQVILPSALRPLVIRELHNNMGHLGVERVLCLAQDRFYWPHMK